MRLVSITLLALFLFASACGEDKSDDGLPPAVAPGSRGSGEACREPDDCQEGLWCLNGECTKPIDSGMERKKEQEQIQDERYEKLDDKVRSIEEQK